MNKDSQMSAITLAGHNYTYDQDPLITDLNFDPSVHGT